MKSFVKEILNEARIQRTIDPKIWASMSSMTSKNRANLAVDAKPMKRDTKEILLQKYVAGLLTMKVACPATESDIDKIKAYLNFGHALLNAGGTLAEVLKLYVENGGQFDGEIADTPTAEEPELDYPSYEDADAESDEEPIVPEDNDVMEEPEETPTHNFDSALSSRDNTEVQSSSDETDTETESHVEDEKPYPSYDEVDTETDDEDDVNDEQSASFEETHEDEDLTHYFKTVGRSLMRANKGDYLVWDLSDGLKISKDKSNAIAICVGIPHDFIDKKSRFMFFDTDEVTLGNAGNNGVYDAYYFKKSTNGVRGRLSVKPGSSYYYLEETKGTFYTSILADNGNNAAKDIKNLINTNNISGVSNELSMEIAKAFNDRAYLPTLPELANAISLLEPGRYWTSSVADDGTANIVLGVNPDKVFKVNDPESKAKVVAFITF